MAHIHEKIDITSEVFVVYQDKVLLRIHDKYKIWLSVGGHVELDEDPNEAAVREVKQEVGLDVELYHDPSYPVLQRDGFRDLVPPEFMNRHRISPTHEHVTLVYFARASTDHLVLSSTEKSAGCKWFTRDELNDSQYKLTPDVQLYTQSALEKLVNT